MRQPALEDVGDPRLGVEVDLVDDRAGDRHAVRGEVRRVEDDLVDRPADAALADDDRRRPEHRRDGRVRQPDDRPDAGVTGPLDQEHLVASPERVAGGDDPRPEVLDDLARDVLLREPARDVDRAHRPVVGREVERLVHEDGVLVGGLAVVDDRPLADGLHERGPQARPLEPVEQAERGGRLAAVLARGREVELAHAQQ